MVEKGILAFENKIEKQMTGRAPNRQSNLTYFQQRSLKELRALEDIHIYDSYKNLGPSASNKTQYKHKMLTEHLNTAAYERLTEEEASAINMENKRLIREIFHNKCGLAKAEIIYLGCSFKMAKRIHQLYGAPK
jgi:hypothetical protein